MNSSITLEHKHSLPTGRRPPPPIALPSARAYGHLHRGPVRSIATNVPRLTSGPLRLQTHLPGYIELADEFKSAGVDEIICTAVNDPFVMTAWGIAQKADGKVTMLADTQYALTKAWDIYLDAEGALGNKRCKRFSAVFKDGKISALNIEADGSGLACSLADVALKQVKGK
jgi:peroxiredoxin 5